MHFKRTFLVIFVGFIIFFPGLALASIQSYFGFDTSSPQGYVNSIYRYGLTLIAVLAVAGLIYGGIRYLTSAGSEEAVTSGKQAVMAALSGLVIALLSHMILKTLDPRLVELRLTVPHVDQPEPSQPIYHGGVGSPCLTDETCNGLTCLRIFGTTQRCTDFAEGSPCASDANCRGVTHCDVEGSYTCVREGGEQEGPRTDGSSCENGNECQSGICLGYQYDICVNGTNSHCLDSDECKNTHYCQNRCELGDPMDEKFCRPKKSNGTNCYTRSECESGDCVGVDLDAIVCRSGTCQTRR